jgi:NAD(P)H-dependent FMN reductase
VPSAKGPSRRCWTCAITNGVLRWFDEDYPADVARLRADIKASDGLIVGSPEYHGCFSGVLKNALDLMRFDEMQGKMIGLLAVSGGPLGSLIGLSSLREVGRSLVPG